jgi:uncharacterized protein involved in exopolysaccharide biosynthesis
MHTQPADPVQVERKINLVEIATIIGEEKRTFFGVPLVTTAIALAYALIATPIFTAQTVILPPQQKFGASAAMLSSLGSLPGSILGAESALRSPTAMYVDFIKSRTVEDATIRHLHLEQHYKVKHLWQAREKLSAATLANADQHSGLITISVDDPSPATAAAIANDEVVELRDLLARVAVTDAQKRAVFFGKLVQKTEAALNSADLRFRVLSAHGGLPVTDVLARNDIEATSALRMQIATKEVELATIAHVYTPDNPRYQFVANQLATLRAQLNRRESGGANVTTATAKGQAAIAALRDMKMQQLLLDATLKQLELARVDEARDGPLVQQIVVAEPPAHKTKPKRAIVVIFGAFIGAILGTLGALTKGKLARLRLDPEEANKLNALHRAWRLRPR